MFSTMANEMTIIHNAILRGLNAIYLQAPHVAAADASAFANYMHQWFRFVELHHDGEEKHFFPEVERISGEKGVMETNRKQHAAFHHGLDVFVAYVREVIADPAKYDGARVVSLIDGFGRLLTTHLNDEIPTILSLRKFGEERMRPIVKVFGDEAGEVMVCALPSGGVLARATSDGGIYGLTVCRKSLAPWSACRGG